MYMDLMLNVAMKERHNYYRGYFVFFVLVHELTHATGCIIILLSVKFRF